MGIMEKKMETTMMGYIGFRVYGAGHSFYLLLMYRLLNENTKPLNPESPSPKGPSLAVQKLTTSCQSQDALEVL